MKSRAAAACWAALSTLLSGCAATLPASLPPPDVGVTDTIPVAPTTGSARSVHFFGWKRFGDDTTDAAIAAAKKGNSDLDLVNVLVNRHIHCFPACEFALFAVGETTVTGTLARYKRMPEWQKPTQDKPVKLDLGQAPPAEILIERLMHLHGDDPKSAADFYGSMDTKTRELIAERVLNGMGVVAEGSTFKIPRDADPARKKFLIWFVETYTTYRPIGE